MKNRKDRDKFNSKNSVSCMIKRLKIINIRLIFIKTLII